MAAPATAARPIHEAIINHDSDTFESWVLAVALQDHDFFFQVAPVVCRNHKTGEFREDFRRDMDNGIWTVLVDYHGEVPGKKAPLLSPMFARTLIARLANEGRLIALSEVEDAVRWVEQLLAMNLRQVRPIVDKGFIFWLTKVRMEAIREITRILGEVREAIRLTAVKAVELGGHLTRLKKEIGRGRWLLFVKENLPFCARTAERYMDVYENREKLDQFDTVSNLKLTDAYRFLAGGKKSSADPEVNPREDKAQAGADKGAIITALTRSLCDGLERLSPDKLKEFEADLLQFKKGWMEEHIREEKK